MSPGRVGIPRLQAGEDVNVGQGRVEINGARFVPEVEYLKVLTERDQIRREMGVVGTRLLSEYPADDPLWVHFERAGLPRDTVAAMAEIINQVRRDVL